jgi:hypothetical protein
MTIVSDDCKWQVMPQVWASSIMLLEASIMLLEASIMILEDIYIAAQSAYDCNVTIVARLL